MPANARILADEDGEFSDWIEIHNSGGTSVDLGGYFLTDDSQELTKWAFPSMTLPAGAYLVVFASAKNRTSDPSHLHTNFRLDAEGGFLALVTAEGATVLSAFNPYPSVKEDVAFGISENQQTISLLSSSVPQILVPTNGAELPQNWNQLTYVPGLNWTNGTPPPSVGFDTNMPSGGGAVANLAPSGTAVQSTTLSSFTPNLGINGNFSDFTHTLGADTAPFWQVTLTNEFAIRSVILYNRTSCCGSRLRDITIEILSTNSSGTVTNWTSALLNPENTGYTYPNGPTAITNDLLALTGGLVYGRIVRVRRTPDPDLSGTGGQGNSDEAAALSLGEVVVNASSTSDYAPYIRNDLQAAMLGRNASAFVRAPWQVVPSLTSTNSPDQLLLRVRYDDGFVAYLNGVEVARRNVPTTLAWDSSATADRASTNGLVQEIIDLSSSIPLLSAGTNLFAVQLLNSSATNSDLLFQPELLAVRLDYRTNVFLAEPTPGAANLGDWYYDEVADTQFSVDRGFFETPFSLSITSATPGAVIYYSFNGDEPGPGKGFLYSGPISITNTTVVRARAFKDGWKATDVDTATYIFIADVITQARDWPQTRVPPPYFPATWGANSVDYGMDPEVVTNYTLAQWREALMQIPSMSIVTEMKNLFDATTGIYANAMGHGEEWERPMSLELLDPTNAVPGRFQENCGLRIRGGFSRNPQFFKHSFRVFFRRDYGAGKLIYPLFENEGAQEFETFDLRTSQNYSWPRNESPTFETMVREVFCRETLGAMGQPYRRSRYYHLYLNGQYWGLYETDERPEASYGQTYFGGSKTNYDVVKCGNRGVTPTFATEATDGNQLAWSNLWSMCQALRTNASNSNYFRPLGRNPDGTRNASYPVLIDVENLIDYMLEIFFSGDGDATLSSFLANNMPNNWFGMRDRTNPDVGFRFFNSDCEHTLGSPSSQVDRTGPFGGSNEGNFLFSNPQWMHEELMRNPEYRVRFSDHVQKHFFNGGALTLEACTNRFLRKAAQINKAIRAYSARWGDAVRTTPPYGESDWTNALNFVLNWFPPRPNLVLSQLRGDGLYPSNAAPTFSQFGGNVPAGYSLQITHTNSSGVIYFTTDGSDPRLIGGGVAPTAQAYSMPIIINGPTLVRARVLIGANWSALVEAVFSPPQDLSKLLITEIMYNPPVVGAVDGDEFEFLEFKNTGTNTINLSSLRFTAGITFTFPGGTFLGPGQFFVLVRNPAQFGAKYPGVAINGVYSGRLDNAGETLTLSHGIGSKVLSVTYGDAAPWPLTADNFGFSLVPKNPNANPDPDNPANWRASSNPGGSPGADDPESTIPPLLINEVLTASTPPAVDAIELFNPTANDANIGGWFLSDDKDVPKKFRVPAGRMVPAGGYLVFDERDFNATPGTNNSFSLNAGGDQVYLFSGDGNTNLTGYSHGFSFDGSDAGVTFGRYVSSTGEEHFPAQISPSLGTNNVGPRVGPIVMNEILYHPGGDDYEFIELLNISVTSVPLFDPASPTNTWRLNGLNYPFPTNVTLPAQEYLLLVPTNPVVFRMKYSVPTNVIILGPYPGVLQDSGERLLLQKAVTPTNTSGATTFFVTVDGVRYNDKAPWPPAADGSGPSLQRRNPAAYGDDPINWLGALPTPGRPLPGGLPPVITSQPTNKTVVAYQDAIFSAAASGTEPLHFQWRFQGDAIAQATNTTLLLSNVQPSQAGNYTLLVFNESGSVESLPARLTVLIPATITMQPQSQSIRLGSNVTFNVSATSSTLLSFQWRFNGMDILGATNSFYSISNVQVSHGGSYSVVVTDEVGPVMSAQATLTVLINPVIVQQPSGLTVAIGSSASFSVSATGNPLPFGYRWRRIGLLHSFISTNQTNMTLTLNSVSNANAGNWTVIVTNQANPSGVVSTNAFLTVVTPPTNQTVTRGGTATFTVSATNVANSFPRYQWRFNGEDISGATTNSYSVTNAQPSHQGSYSVVVIATNIPTPPPASFAATLTVLTPLLLSNPEVLSNGMFRAQLEGVSNRIYRIESSQDLTNWSVLTNVTYTGSPTLFVDPGRTNAISLSGTNRFYRARETP
jgi:hypothetical protein